MGTGVKHDAGKSRVELLSGHALLALGDAARYGAAKYSDRNWEGGMKWSRVLGATLRHLFAFMSGEVYDKESGLHHVSHAMWGCMVLLDYHITSRGENDIYADGNLHARPGLYGLGEQHKDRDICPVLGGVGSKPVQVTLLQSDSEDFGHFTNDNAQAAFGRIVV
jgi:Domain of unknown function (DUF5664)